MRFSVIPSRAFDDNRINSRAIVVLGIIGCYSDRDGWCFPSQVTLAKRLGVSRQAVIKQVNILVECGYIEKRQRTRDNLSTTSCMYRILYDPILEDRYDRSKSPKTANTEGVLEEYDPDTTDTTQDTEKEVVLAPHLEEYGEVKITKPKNGPFIMGTAIATATGMHFKLNTGRIMKAAKEFISAGIDSAILLDIYHDANGIWYTQDWRGKRGETPTIEQIKQTWVSYYEKYRSRDVAVQEPTMSAEGWFNG
jgi:hypothetical protein